MYKLQRLDATTNEWVMIDSFDDQTEALENLSIAKGWFAGVAEVRILRAD